MALPGFEIGVLPLDEKGVIHEDRAMNSMNGEPRQFEPAPPVDLGEFGAAVTEYLAPKLQNLEARQRIGQGDAGGDPRRQQRIDYAMELCAKYKREGLSHDDALRRAVDEAEQRHGISAQITELETAKEGVLQGGEAALPFLSIINKELEREEPKLRKRIDYGAYAEMASIHSFTEDEEFFALDKSVRAGALGLAALQALEEGAAKSWLYQAAELKLTRDTHGRDATPRGKAILQGRQASKRLEFLNRLRRDAEKMQQWTAAGSSPSET